MKNQKSEYYVSLTIDSDAQSSIYNPNIFGGFLEHFGHQVYGGVFAPGSPLADKNGFRWDVIEALRELKVPIVRWPGGCYVSGYHWEEGVGTERTPTDDMAWGVVEPHTFGTDEFVELCHLLDWEPYICNNAGNGSVQEMTDWVAYCNSSEGKYAQMRKDNGYDDPLNVRIWSIGNENWGQHEIGYKTVEQWSPFVLKAAKAMKVIDPTIQLSAASLPTREWTLPMLKMAGEYLDYISVHKYWLGFWQENMMPDYMTCIMHSEGPETFISEAISVLEASGYRGRIKIAFDEWNLRGWHHPGFPRKKVQDYSDPEIIELVAARDKNLIPSQYTMADALFTASFFNACLRHADDVGMANIAPIVNTRGPLHVHPAGIVKRTHFHAMVMYANLLGSHVVEAEVKAGFLTHENQSVPVMDAVVTRDDAGKEWSIAMVNRHPTDELICQMLINGELLEGSYVATILSGDSVDSYNDIKNPNCVLPAHTQLLFKEGKVTLPAHSLTIIEVSLA